MFLKLVQVVTRIMISSFFAKTDDEPTFNAFVEHSVKTSESMEQGQSSALIHYGNRSGNTDHDAQSTTSSSDGNASPHRRSHRKHGFNDDLSAELAEGPF